MAWTEDGFETHIAAPRRALRERMAERLEEEAVDTPGNGARILRKHAQTLRDLPLTGVGSCACVVPFQQEGECMMAGVNLLIDYTHGDGRHGRYHVAVTTIRDAYAMQGQDEPDLHVIGFCAEQGRITTFNAGRIRALADLDTGEAPDNPLSWLAAHPLLSESRNADRRAAAARDAHEDIHLRARLMTAVARAHKPLSDRRKRDFCDFLAGWAATIDPAPPFVDDFIRAVLANRSGNECLLLELAARPMGVRAQAVADARSAAVRDGLTTAQQALLDRAAQELGI